jgi:hypothetical protein
LANTLQYTSKKAYIQYQQESLFTVTSLASLSHLVAATSSTPYSSLPPKMPPQTTHLIVTPAQPFVAFMARFGPLILPSHHCFTSRVWSKAPSILWDNNGYIPTTYAEGH